MQEEKFLEIKQLSELSARKWDDMHDRPPIERAVAIKD